MGLHHIKTEKPPALHEDVDPAPEKNPALFVSGFMPNFLSLSLRAYYLLSLGTFTSVFKDNKSLRSHKTVEIKFFCLLMEVSNPYK